MINSLFFRMRTVHLIGIVLLLINAILFTDNIVGTIVQVVIAVVILIHDIDEKINGVDITKNYSLSAKYETCQTSFDRRKVF